MTIIIRDFVESLEYPFDSFYCKEFMKTHSVMKERKGMFTFGTFVSFRVF